MNGCPPQPGLTDMQRIRSAASVSSVTASAGVPGFKRQARQAAGLADRAEGPIGVRVGLEVEA